MGQSGVRPSACPKCGSHHCAAARAALATAADDLDKAANQFEGLEQGILHQHIEVGLIPGVNSKRFAGKAKRARDVADA